MTLQNCNVDLAFKRFGCGYERLEFLDCVGARRRNWSQPQVLQIYPALRNTLYVAKHEALQAVAQKCAVDKCSIYAW